MNVKKSHESETKKPPISGRFFCGVPRGSRTLATSTTNSCANRYTIGTIYLNYEPEYSHSTDLLQDPSKEKPAFQKQVVAVIFGD